MQNYFLGLLVFLISVAFCLLFFDKIWSSFGFFDPEICWFSFPPSTQFWFLLLVPLSFSLSLTTLQESNLRWKFSLFFTYSLKEVFFFLNSAITLMTSKSTCPKLISCPNLVLQFHLPLNHFYLCFKLLI